MTRPITYTLIGSKFARSLLVEMVFAELDIPFHYEEVNILENEHKSTAFLSKNPAGWIPVLITDRGEKVFETPAINTFLCEQHTHAGLIPVAGAIERARFLSAFALTTGDLEPAIKRFFYAYRFTERKEDIPAVRSKALEAALERMDVLEILTPETSSYYLGESLSLIDITLAYWMWYVRPEGLETRCPKLSAVMDRVRHRPKLVPLFARLDELHRLYFEMINLPVR